MKTLLFPLSHGTLQTPTATALCDGRQSWSYAEFEEKVETLAGWWRSQGISRGAPVALLGELNPTCLLMFWSLLRVGAIVAPLSTRWTQEERQHALQPVRPVALVAQQGSVGASDGKNWRVFLWHTACKQAKLMTDAPALEADSFEETQPATLIWTSGSSSQPKAALHSHGNHWFNALGSRENLPLESGHSWLLSLPVYHVAGVAILMRCAQAGATVLIPKRDETLAESVCRMKPTHLSLVPTQLRRLLQSGEEMVAHLQQMKGILLGGSAMPASLLQEAISLKLPIFTSYGATEMASQITTTRPDSTLDDFLHSSGWLLPHRELRLNEEGAICLRGKTRFLGYWTEQGLHEPFDDDGWLVTRDRGAWNSNGSLRVCGRLDNMMISGGENIQPEEIESILQQHHNVAQAVVVPMEDEEFGQRPVAIIQWKRPEEPALPELLASLRERLAKFKIPEHFLNWPLETPQSGFKVSRSQLRQYAKECLQKE